MEAIQISIQSFKNHWLHDKFQPSRTAQDYFDSGVRLMQEKNYKKALPCFLVISQNFKDSIYYQDALLATGQCFFALNQYDLANIALSNYLAQNSSKDNLNLILNLKYNIAEQYAQGYRKHLYSIEGLPRLEDATSDAYDLYDEVYSMVDDKDLAAKALFSKATLLKKNKSLDLALTHFQDLTKQFPQHPLCLKSFVEVSNIYLEQSLSESHNTSYLSLALLNQEQAETRFPSCKELTIIATNIEKIKEHYALTLFNIGVFYQKKNKPKAAKIYFQTSINNYPDSQVAKKSQKKLLSIK